MKLYGLSRHGDKKSQNLRWINEDGLKVLNFSQYNCQIGIIMDGATGLGKKYNLEIDKTLAEWYVNFMLEQLTKIFNDDFKIPLKDAIEQAIKISSQNFEQIMIRNNWQLEDYEKPSAALAIIRIIDNYTELFVLGDIVTIVGYKNRKIKEVYNPNQRKLKKYDNRVIKVMRKIAKKDNINIIETINNNTVQQLLQKNRSKKNKKQVGSYYVCGFESWVSKKGVYRKFKNSKLEKIILTTDGMDYFLKKYKYFFEKTNSFSLEQIMDELHDYQITDCLCNRFPRLKVEDDKTILVLDFIK